MAFSSRVNERKFPRKIRYVVHNGTDPTHAGRAGKRRTSIYTLIDPRDVLPADSVFLDADVYTCTCYTDDRRNGSRYTLCSAAVAVLPVPFGKHFYDYPSASYSAIKIPRNNHHSIHLRIRTRARAHTHTIAH